MQQRKTIAVCTLGCKVNQYDSDAVLVQFREAGYEVVDFHEKADVYLINTCTVTNTGDRKSRQMIRRAHGPKAGGCHGLPRKLHWSVEIEGKLGGRHSPASRTAPGESTPARLHPIGSGR